MIRYSDLLRDNQGADSQRIWCFGTAGAIERAEVLYSMSCKNIMPALLSVAAMTMAVAPVVHADAWDKKTIATFSQSIEIPGKVLAPGTYVFKLMDSPSNRHIVRITNEREDQVIATVLAIPN